MRPPHGYSRKVTWSSASSFKSLPPALASTHARATANTASLPPSSHRARSRCEHVHEAEHALVLVLVLVLVLALQVSGRRRLNALWPPLHTVLLHLLTLCGWPV